MAASDATTVRGLASGLPSGLAGTDDDLLVRSLIQDCRCVAAHGAARLRDGGRPRWPPLTVAVSDSGTGVGAAAFTQLRSDAVSMTRASRVTWAHTGDEGIRAAVRCRIARAKPTRSDPYSTKVQQRPLRGPTGLQVATLATASALARVRLSW